MGRRIPVVRAWGQAASQVVVREPGDRFLSDPQPIQPYAHEHWEFAWLSVAAYQKTRAGAKEAARLRQRTAARDSAVVDADADPEQLLNAAGWTRWRDFPDELL